MKELRLIFDVAWNEDKELHLVKPVSFDLTRQDSINKKAYQYYGQFLDLETFAQENHYLFDVLLAKFKAKNLYKAYDHAIRLLEIPKAVKLIEQGDLTAYSKATVESALI